MAIRRHDPRGWRTVLDNSPETDMQFRWRVTLDHHAVPWNERLHCLRDFGTGRFVDGLNQLQAVERILIPFAGRWGLTVFHFYLRIIAPGATESESVIDRQSRNDFRSHRKHGRIDIEDFIQNSLFIYQQEISVAVSIGRRDREGRLLQNY
jgi:hypothetical protein